MPEEEYYRMLESNDENSSLDAYILDLINQVRGGTIPREKASEVIDLLIEKLEAAMVSHSYSSPEGAEVLVYYYSQCIQLYLESLFKLRSFLNMPQKEAIVDSISLATRASVVMSNIKALTKQTRELLVELQEGQKLDPYGEYDEH